MPTCECSCQYFAVITNRPAVANIVYLHSGTDRATRCRHQSEPLFVVVVVVVFHNLLSFWPSNPRYGIAYGDADIEVDSVENPELSMVFIIKPGVG